MENMNFVTAAAVSEPRETVKAIMENMDAIITEMENGIRMISDGLTGATPFKEDEYRKTMEDHAIVDRLRIQRDRAVKILENIARIREVLW